MSRAIPPIDIQKDAQTIVDLLCSPDFRRGRELIIDRATAIKLVVTALKVTHQHGVIEGMAKMADAYGPPEQVKALSTANDALEQQLTELEQRAGVPS